MEIDDPDVNLSAIKQSIEIARSRVLFLPKQEEIQRFSRFCLAGDIAKVFDRLL
jgi:hypothetical protein